MSYSHQITSQNSTSSSRVSSLTRVHHDTPAVQVTGTLRLRAEGDAQNVGEEMPVRHIRWSEDVVDNEGMGKKSSKVCCIYHKTRPVGESSSESESSDSESDSDSGCETKSSNERRSCGHSNHRHDAAHKSSRRGRASDGHSHDNEKVQRRKPSPNAYEKMPKYTKG
ncbi:phosphatase inhibitor-domain-containing protein [Aspergillus nidulans var. acristatus]